MRDMYVVRINYADGMFAETEQNNASTIFMGDDAAAAQRAFSKSECLDFRVDESWFRLTEFTVVERSALMRGVRRELREDLKNIAKEDGALREEAPAATAITDVPAHSEPAPQSARRSGR